MGRKKIYEEILDIEELEPTAENLEEVEIPTDEEIIQDMNDKVLIDDVKTYLKDIGKYKLLSKEEVAALLAKGDKSSKDKVVESNLKLAFSIAKKYQNRGIPLMDLVQEANIGLIKAVDRFEPAKGYTFATYATWWITAAVRRCIQENSSGVRLPVYMSEMIGKVKSAQQYFEMQNMEYTEEDIASKTGLKVAEVKKALAAQKNSETLSLDYESDDDMGPLSQTVVDDQADIEKNFIMDERSILIRNIIHTNCSPKEEDVVLRHLGFIGKPQTFDEIAADYNISKQRIQQLFSKGMEKLKKAGAKRAFEALLS